MATTTNYGWVTPDDTSLVKDGAAAIRTLGSSVDTTTKALNPSTTLGDIEYRSATANTNTRLPLGTAGQVLTVNSGATAPEWATPAGGGGKVLQVVFASTNTPTTVASTTYTDSTLSATITPTSATSTILIIYNQQLIAQRQTSAASGQVRLLRGATEIQDLKTVVDCSVGGGTSIYNANTVGSTYRDSPATTSATTYKTQVKSTNTANSGQVLAQEGNAVSTMTLLEIGA
jgi:hypothetical protein